MSLQTVNTLWDQIQKEQQALLATWFPNSNILYSTDPIKMIEILNDTMTELFNTDTIIHLQWKLVQAQAQLSPEDFKIWLLGGKNRTNRAAQKHSEILTQKLINMMKLAQHPTSSTVH